MKLTKALESLKTMAENTDEEKDLTLGVYDPNTNTIKEANEIHLVPYYNEKTGQTLYTISCM